MLSLAQAVIDAFQSPARMFDCNITVHFPGIAPVVLNIEEHLSKVVLLEEEYGVSGLPFGRATSNELAIELNNKDSLFSFDNTAGPYYGKLVAGLKVDLLFKINVFDPLTETYTWYNVASGTYYTHNWSKGNDGADVFLTCFDKWHKYREKPLTPSRVHKNITVNAALVALFSAAGLSASDYNIEAGLTYVMPYYFYGNTSLGEEIQKFITGYGLRVYVDKFDKIQIKKQFSTGSVLTLDDDDMIISVSGPSDRTKYFSSVDMHYTTYAESDRERLLFADLNTGLNKRSFSHPGTLRVTDWQVKNHMNLLNYNNQDVEITSGADTNIDLYGVYLVPSNNNIEVNSAPLASLVGDKQTKVTSHVIQNNAEAISLGNAILTQIEVLDQAIRVHNRGNLALELGDVVTINDEENDVYGNFYVHRMQHTFDGGLEANYTLLRMKEV